MLALRLCRPSLDTGASRRELPLNIEAAGCEGMGRIVVHPHEQFQPGYALPE